MFHAGANSMYDKMYLYSIDLKIEMFEFLLKNKKVVAFFLQSHRII